MAAIPMNDGMSQGVFQNGRTSSKARPREAKSVVAVSEMVSHLSGPASS